MFLSSARAARLLRCGASTIVLGAALLQAHPAFAQVQPTDDTAAQAQPDSDTAATPLSQRTSTKNPTPPSAPEKNAIIITGQRQALRTSQQIKKNADTVVDSITVRTQNMEETARELADLACTEALSFLLGQRIGQAKAFNLIHQLCQDALDRKKPIREAALASP